MQQGEEQPAIDVYLEIGARKTFAAAVDWPGWCRAGRGGEEALRALIGYGTRYAASMANAGLEVSLPAGDGDLSIVERLQGNASTDFGVPGQIPAADHRPLDDRSELTLLEAVMRGSWTALEASARAAKGVSLRRGPRGGGRDLAAIVDHVTSAEESYIGSADGKRAADGGTSVRDRTAATHERLIEALRDGAPGRLRTTGPRGGLYWPPRYLVRRAAWHVLDHAWEIEDRASSG